MVAAHHLEERTMDNPLELKLPDDPIDRIHTMALDLAYGVSRGLWGTNFTVDRTARDETWMNWSNIPNGGPNLDDYMEKKWANSPPSAYLMLSFGYFVVFEQKDGYLLTAKAFALLQKPTTPPSVFISYARKQSSALALLIEARLKLEDRNLRAFIDKDIPLGDEWRDVLVDRISASQYFICLLTMDTLLSKPVAEEIAIALKTPTCKIIPICHSGYSFKAEFPAALGERAVSAEVIQTLATKNALVVETESAASYEDKVNRLLGRLGYSTI